ncbi:type II toxin-antitoxin system VapC family toxin [Methylobacterium sp. WSM2598]|uniref:type II toxin-antitoxin system VapC family toxin n=1 Tax=Methylobacterium sp. WSM2598 TaxID=398261 RepID=UPI00037BDD44|nr:type II toxin-antitoxin system VapC family toxin [Methylobacterium sp. WSM2598]
MTRPAYVLDASALLCLLFDEPGAARVEAVLHQACVSAANYAEVIGKLVDRGQSPEEAVADLRELDLEVIPLDRAQAEAAGGLRASTREAGLALGDRACLALAASRGAVAVTTDQAWRKVGGADTVEVVR